MTTDTHTNPNRPAATIRDGNLKATVWRNASDSGPWYSVDLIRSYKTDDGWQDTTSMRSDDLPRIAFLAQRAYAAVLDLKQADRESDGGRDA